MHPLFVTKHLFATEHERHALRCEDRSLRQEVQSYLLLHRKVGYAGFQAVVQTHVVVAAHIADHLCRLCGPRLLGIVHLGHVYLWVCYCAGDAKLDAFFQPCDAGEKRPLAVVRERATECIAQFIAESTDAWHLFNVGLECQLFRRIGTRSCAPSLAIDIY